MINTRLFVIAVAMLLAVASAAHAAGDAEAGKGKAAACAACHGANGNSANPQWPNLAGQHEGYLYQQLKHFKSGERSNPVMAGQVANLSDQDMQDLAAYFAGLEMEVGAANEDIADKGEAIWRGGIPERNVPACAACHGPGGDGMKGAGYPRLGGQKATYLVSQLQAYRSGDRNGYDAATIMVDVAGPLTDEEIEAVASFASGLYIPENGTDGE